MKSDEREELKAKAKVLWAEGAKYREICKLLGVGLATLNRWVQTFREESSGKVIPFSPPAIQAAKGNTPRPGYSEKAPPEPPPGKRSAPKRNSGTERAATRGKSGSGSGPDDGGEGSRGPLPPDGTRVERVAPWDPAKLQEPSGDLTRDFLAFLLRGNFPAVACDYVGLSYPRFLTWMERGTREAERLEEHPEAPDQAEAPYLAFALAVRRACAVCESAVVESMLEAPTTWKAFLAWLEQRSPERWCERKEVKVSGDPHNPLTTAVVVLSTADMLARLDAAVPVRTVQADLVSPKLGGKQ